MKFSSPFLDDVKFEEKTVKVSPSNPELPTLTPSAFKVSGKVSSSTKENLQNRKVVIKNTSTGVETKVEVDPTTGEWSTYLTLAKYQLSIAVSDEEKTKGLQYEILFCFNAGFQIFIETLCFLF